MNADTLTPSDISEAKDDLLRNVDTLQDWISGECMGKPSQPWLAQLREIDVTLYGSAFLLAFAFDRGQLAKNRAAAMNELAARFLLDSGAIVLLLAIDAADARIAA